MFQKTKKIKKAIKRPKIGEKSAKYDDENYFKEFH